MTQPHTPAPGDRGRESDPRPRPAADRPPVTPAELVPVEGGEPMPYETEPERS